jgi:hypothetical protein
MIKSKRLVVIREKIPVFYEIYKQKPHIYTPKIKRKVTEC